MMAFESNGDNVEMEFNDADLDSFLNQCTDTWACPVCADKGVTARVILHQANDRQAIYFCETKECIYPQTDDVEPVVVNRSLLELPVDMATLEKFGFPLTLMDEGGLTFEVLLELCLIHDAYKEYDDWARLEKELQRLKNTMDKECESNSAMEAVPFNPKCTPLNHLREMHGDLIKYVKHFIPNIHEILELLRMDIL